MKKGFVVRNHQEDAEVDVELSENELISGYVSKLWASDWGSEADSIYDLT